MKVFAKIVSVFRKILNLPLYLGATCGKVSISDVDRVFKFAFATINYSQKDSSQMFQKIVNTSLKFILKQALDVYQMEVRKYLFTKFHHISSNTMYGQIQVTLCSTYLLSNENYNAYFLTIYFYRLWRQFLSLLPKINCCSGGWTLASVSTSLRDFLFIQ